MRHTITVDGRGMTSLAGVRRQDHRQYEASESEDGTITLIPLTRVRVRISPVIPDDTSGLEKAPSYPGPLEVR